MRCPSCNSHRWYAVDQVSRRCADCKHAWQRQQLLCGADGNLRHQGYVPVFPVPASSLSDSLPHADAVPATA